MIAFFYLTLLCPSKNVATAPADYLSFAYEGLSDYYEWEKIDGEAIATKGFIPVQSQRGTSTVSLPISPLESLVVPKDHKAAIQNNAKGDGNIATRLVTSHDVMQSTAPDTTVLFMRMTTVSTLLKQKLITEFSSQVFDLWLKNCRLDLNW